LGRRGRSASIRICPPTSAATPRHPERPAEQRLEGLPRALAGVFAAERKAAAAYERAEKHRERDRAEAEAAAQRKRERGQQAIDKAQTAFDAANGEHAERTAAIEAEREAIEKKLEAENARWDKKRARGCRRH
jgi:hypothetical protein